MPFFEENLFYGTLFTNETEPLRSLFLRVLNDFNLLQR